MPDPVTVIHNGRRGRPRKVVNLAYLQEAMSSHRAIPITKLAKALNMHPHTLRHELRRHGVTRQFSQLSDSDLDLLVRLYKSTKPDSGLRYLVGFLRYHGLRVQRRRVLYSVRRVDSLGRALRVRKAIKRRKYSVKRPNSLWHLDGHHKLIMWGVVIHGFIDGYCRTVSVMSLTYLSCCILKVANYKITALRASTNNRASTVLAVFLHAVDEYGCPSRMRGDRGGENKATSVYMIMRKGPNRGSFMWGS